MRVGIQLSLLVVFAMTAGALWMARDQIGSFMTGFAKAGKPDGGIANGRAQLKVPVIVTPVKLSRDAEVVAAIGTARAARSVMIYSKIEGILVALKPRAGDKVSAGDTILELDAAKARLAVRLARNNLDEARRQFDRARQLWERQLQSQANFETSKTALEKAQLELLQAEENVRDHRIEAPFDGIVGISKVEVGDRVGTSTPIVSLDQRDTLLIEFEVAEKYAAQIAVGDPITATTPGHGETKFSGHIGYIDSRIDPASRSMTVRAVLPNANDLLRPGMSFVVERSVSSGEYPTVPELALQWSKGSSYVWIVRDAKAQKIPVKTIMRRDNSVLVRGELSSEDLVVIEGVQRLRPGRPVDFEIPQALVPSRPPAVALRSPGPETPAGAAAIGRP